MASSELRSLPRELSYFRKVWDTARITQAVYDYSYPGSGKPEDPFVLRWIPNDPGNAMEWGAGIRWASISIQAFAIFTIALNSSAFSGNASHTRKLYLQLIHSRWTARVPRRLSDNRDHHHIGHLALRQSCLSCWLSIAPC